MKRYKNHEFYSDVIPAKAKPRAGIQGVTVWMPDQVRHDNVEVFAVPF